MKYNYGFYVTGGGRLAKLLKSNSKVKEAIKLVFCDAKKGTYLAELCSENNIPFYLNDYLNYQEGIRHKELSDMLLEQLYLHKIDYLFSFGGHILEGELLDRYSGRLINFHPALLPAYRGCKAIDRAIAAGEEMLGNTAHFIDEGMDTGEIILQQSVEANVFYEEGYDGILDLQLNMLESIIYDIEADKLREKYNLKTPILKLKWER